MEIENTSQFTPSSPKTNAHRRLRPSISESSATLMDNGPPQLVPEAIYPHSHRPTIEQNMAFAALQQSQQELNTNMTNNTPDQSNTRI
jgi:hypothetical protein